MDDVESRYWKELADALIGAGAALSHRATTLEAAVNAMATASANLVMAGQAVQRLQADLHRARRSRSSDQTGATAD